MRNITWVVVTQAEDGTLGIHGRANCCSGQAACAFGTREEAEEAAKVFPNDASYQVHVQPMEGI